MFGTHVYDMDELKHLLNHDATKVVLSKEALGLLMSHTSVSCNGVLYKTCDLLQKHCCSSCSELLLQNHALALQLKEEAKVPIEVVLRGYFEAHYQRTTGRLYSRKRLFKEVTAFLKINYQQVLLTPSDARYKWFVKEVVRDTSKNYKKLKIRKKVLY